MRSSAVKMGSRSSAEAPFLAPAVVGAVILAEFLHDLVANTRSACAMQVLVPPIVRGCLLVVVLYDRAGEAVLHAAQVLLHVPILDRPAGGALLPNLLTGIRTSTTLSPRTHTGT